MFDIGLCICLIFSLTLYYCFFLSSLFRYNVLCWDILTFMQLFCSYVMFLTCQNLTEFNTAHNKRISLLTIEEGNLEIQRPKRKRKNSRVTFSEEDSIINPGTQVSYPKTSGLLFYLQRVHEKKMSFDD